MDQETIKPILVLPQLCPECEESRPARLVQKIETINVLEKLCVRIQVEVLVCAECGKEIFDEELDAAHQQRAFRIYELVTREKVVKGED